jgi:hypothetical protein
MKADARSVGASINQAIVKGRCPVCGILKDFQWTLVETTRPQPDTAIVQLSRLGDGTVTGKAFAFHTGKNRNRCFFGDAEETSNWKSEQRRVLPMPPGP